MVNIEKYHFVTDGILEDINELLLTESGHLPCPKFFDKYKTAMALFKKKIKIF